MMTLGGFKPTNQGEQTIESKSTFIPPRDGDMGPFLEDNKHPLIEKSSLAHPRGSQSPHNQVYRNLSHLTRIRIFEQEKKRKIEAAKQQKEKAEMENVTFQPVLVARKKSVGCLNSRNNQEEFGRTDYGYKRKGKLYRSNAFNEINGSIQSQIKQPLETSKFFSQNEETLLLDTPKLGTVKNSQKVENKTRYGVSQSANFSS